VRKWWSLVALVLVVLGLLLLNLGFFGWSAYERSEVSRIDLSCPLPGMDSQYTGSEWRWMPPGRACIFGEVAFDEPSWRRAIGVVILPVMLGLSVVVLIAQTRRTLTTRRGEGA
jgi:hypothetical protein